MDIEMVTGLFPAKWLPALAVFRARNWMEPGFWGVQIQPADHGPEGHADLVATDTSAMLRICDEQSFLWGDPQRRTVDISFPRSFVDQCKVKERRLFDVNKDAAYLELPEWLQPETVHVLGLGMDDTDSRTRTASAWIRAKAQHPAIEGGDGLSLATCNLHYIGYAHSRITWEHIAAKAETTAAVDGLLLQTKYLKRLAHIGTVASFRFSGATQAVTVTFTDAPEATAWLMPCLPNAPEPEPA